MRPTNLAFLQIAKRAESRDDEVLKRTFVDFGAVFTIVSSTDHQVIFGRRGTGKTHLLSVLRQDRMAKDEIAIQLDMRNLGSSGGIYGDPSVHLAQRATRLLIDVLAAMHRDLFDQAIDRDGLVDLGAAGSALDEFFDAHSAVKVVGEATVSVATSAESAAQSGWRAGLAASLAGAAISGGAQLGASEKETDSVTTSVTGREVCRVNFGRVGAALRKVVDALPGRKLWILIDEWSEVPLDLQPYLADLLRRAVLPTKGITLKLAAIEQRSRMLIPDARVGHIGLELGADISAAVNLDDYMVFDNDEHKAVSFFKSLVYKHVRAALEARKLPAPATEAELISHGFTQTNAFHEVVRACEGVPRDAINILGQAASRASERAITVDDVRAAARQWYQASKDAAVSAHDQARALLAWIVDKVIKERQTKAFLLEANIRDPLIDFLYDERVLHVLRKGMSAKDAPGKRFNVYGIDYGCYVDLVNTARAPRGILDLGESDSDFVVSVPKTDFRSIRRCVLTLSDFYERGLDGGTAATP